MNFKHISCFKLFLVNFTSLFTITFRSTGIYFNSVDIYLLEIFLPIGNIQYLPIKVKVPLEKQFQVIRNTFSFRIT